MRWIPVTESLPIIPKYRYGIRVLVCTFDPIYEELSPGNGLRVSEVTYAKLTDRDDKKIPTFEHSDKDYDFMELDIIWSDNGKSLDWGPLVDEVVCWQYLPEIPKYTTVLNEEKDRLEYVHL